jgi:ribosomal protein L32
MEDAKRATRRHHDDDLKRQVLEECGKPGASVVSNQQCHLDAKWVRDGDPTAEVSRIADAQWCIS